MQPKRSFAFLSTLLFLVACGGDQAQSAKPGGGQGQATGTGKEDDHGERVPLGEVKLGTHAIAVFQMRELAAGQECDFDLEFPAGAPLPAAVRGWIGAESSVGSMKARFGKEAATRMHGHVEAPSPLAADAKLWLEIDGPDGPLRASVGIRR